MCANIGVLIMRKLLTSAAVLAIIVLGIYSIDQHSQHVYQEYLSPVGFDGTLAVAESEVKPVLDMSEEKIASLLNESKEYSAVSNLISWVSVLSASVIMIISGFFGYKSGIDNSTIDANLDKVEKSLKPRWFKAILLLIAIGNVCTLFTQKFDQISTEKNLKAKELNLKLVEASQVIFDSKSTEAQVRLLLRGLKFEVNSN